MTTQEDKEAEEEGMKGRWREDGSSCEITAFGIMGRTKTADWLKKIQKKKKKNEDKKQTTHKTLFDPTRARVEDHWVGMWPQEDSWQVVWRASESLVRYIALVKPEPSAGPQRNTSLFTQCHPCLPSPAFVSLSSFGSLTFSCWVGFRLPHPSGSPWSFWEEVSSSPRNPQSATETLEHPPSPPPLQRAPVPLTNPNPAFDLVTFR